MNFEEIKRIFSHKGLIYHLKRIQCIVTRTSRHIVASPLRTRAFYHPWISNDTGERQSLNPKTIAPSSPVRTSAPYCIAQSTRCGYLIMQNSLIQLVVSSWFRTRTSSYSRGGRPPKSQKYASPFRTSACTGCCTRVRKTPATQSSSPFGAGEGLT